MTPVDRPVRPEGDDTPRQEVEVIEVTREQLLRQRSDLLAQVDVGFKMRLDDIDFLLGWYAGADRRAASAAPETSPDATALYSAIENAWRDDEDLMRPDNWDQMAAVAVQAVVAALAAHPATPTETSEH